MADRTTVGSAVAGSGAANSLPTGQSAAAVLAKSVWQAGYALKSRGAESLRAGEGIPRTQVTAVPIGTGLPSAKRRGEAVGAKRSRRSRLRAAGTRVRDTGRRGAIGRGAPLRTLACRPAKGRSQRSWRPKGPGCMRYPHRSVARRRIVDLRRERRTVYRTLTPGAAAKPPGSTAHKRYVRGAGLVGRRAGIDTRW